MMIPNGSDYVDLLHVSGDVTHEAADRAIRLLNDVSSWGDPDVIRGRLGGVEMIWFAGAHTRFDVMIWVRGNGAIFVSDRRADEAIR